MSLLRTVKVLLTGDDAPLQRARPRRSPAGVEYSPPPPDPTSPPPAPASPPRRYVGPVHPATVDLARRFQEEAEALLLRPDAVVGQTLAAAYDYLAANGWLDGPRPKVLSTAPQGDGWGRIVLVITDPPNLDPDLWLQLRDHDRLTCVVRP